jgi:hypothetical protein
MRVKYNCETWRWQFDWAGVSEEEAAKHGYRPMPRPVVIVGGQNRPPTYRPRWRRPQIKLVHDGRAAKAALRAERAAAAREKQRLYQAAYYAAHRGLHAKRGAAWGRPGHPLWATPAARRERRAALSRVRSRAWYAAKRAARAWHSDTVIV